MNTKYRRDKFEEQRIARGWSIEKLETRIHLLRKRLLRKYPLHAIYGYDLDNPFMTEGARRVMINEYKRMKATKRGALTMNVRK